jgi:hypothetical protein
MSQKINFYSVDVNLEINHPQPSSKFLPEWFRKIAGVVAGKDTIKKCMPFLDSMTTGYMLVLAADVYFDGVGVQQISKLNLVMTHDKTQIGEMQIPKEYSKQPYKWNNFFVMRTPRGYSTLFTHPMNRIDLPFYTMSGVVETDKFALPVNFPFFIKKDFVGIIPAGTPIAQAIPFKRTDWKHHVEDEKQIDLPGYRFTMHNPPFGFYKKNFWSRKKYQ